MKPTAEAIMNADIDRLVEQTKLNSWTEFVDALNVPNDLFPALMSNRPELVKLVKPRPLGAEEHGVYLDLIAGLMETNRALREHASTLARLTANWADAFTALRSVGHRIERFANFKRSSSHGEDDDD
jgi:hypothetical protein